MEKQKGVSILLSVLILSFILTIAFGISTILVRQSKIIREAGYSVSAFYAADSGVEAVLYQDKLCYPPSCTTTAPGPNCTASCRGLKSPYSTTTIFSNNAEYSVNFSTSGAATAIISRGNYQDANRAVQVTY
jgi:hypothetical protein